MTLYKNYTNPPPPIFTYFKILLFSAKFYENSQAAGTAVILLLSQICI